MGKSTIELTAVDQTKAAFESVNRHLEGVTRGIESAKGAFSAFTGLAAAAGLTDLFKEAAQAASKAEQASNRLNAVIKATGDTSGYTRQQLDEMAESLSKATTFDDDGIREAQANLMKFGRLHGETFERALKLSADYAAFTGGTMVEASQAIGRALADPVNGLKALGQALGGLSETEKQAIQTAMDHGRVLQAQEVIFSKLEKSIGGTAGSMNQGLYGATTAVSKAWDDLLKSIGRSQMVKGPAEVALDTIAVKLREIEKIVEKGTWSSTLMTILQGVTPLGQAGKILGDLTAPPGTADRTATGKIRGVDSRTPDEKAAQERAEAARRAEEDQARAEAAAKLEKARLDELAKAQKNQAELLDLVSDAQDRWNRMVAEGIKASHEYEDRLQAYDVKHLQAAQDIENAAMIEGQRNLEIYNADVAAREQALLDKRIAVLDSLRTEREIEDQAWVERQQILRERYYQDYDNREFWYKKMWQLDQQHQNKLKEIENPALFARQKMVKQAMAGDLVSMGQFFGEAEGLMQAKSRKLFEIGKAAAYAQTVVNTAAAVMSALKIEPFPVGLALAALAAAKGAISLQAINAAQFNGGGSAGGAVPTFSASPATGLSSDFNQSSGIQQVAPVAQAQPAQTKIITVQLIGSRMYSPDEVREKLIPALNEAVGDGVVLRATVVQ